MMQTPYNTSTQGQYCHSCGMFHHHSQSCCYNNNNNNNNNKNNSNAGSYSMVFSMQNGGVFEQNGEDYHSSSVVDCTLSLGTPSTRLCEEDEKRRRSTSSGASSCISNFWDLLHTKNNNKTAPFNNAPSFSSNKPTRGCSGGGGSGGGGGGGGGDSLLARRCANCDTTSTPLWRNGPRGPKSLCNACGIRFKKEERRTTAASGNTVVGAAPVPMDQYGHHNSGYNNYQTATVNNNNNNGTAWAHHHSTQRVPCNYPANEIRFMDDYNGGGAINGDSEGAHGGVPFLSWRLNVADRASLVHDFTR